MCVGQIITQEFKQMDRFFSFKYLTKKVPDILQYNENFITLDFHTYIFFYYKKEPIKCTKN